MKLLIIRHGEPDYDADWLTEKGLQEAELLKQRLAETAITAIYCSPLGRARATAEPTLEKTGLNSEICPWLREFDGFIIDPETREKHIAWDLMPRIWTAEPDYYHNKNWLKTPLMQSGNVREKYYSVCSELDAVLKKHGYERSGNTYKVLRENRDTLAFFCHFGVECVLLSHLLGISPVPLWHGFCAQPSSVTELVTEEREHGTAYFRYLGFGDISHLYASNEAPSFQARFCETYSNFEERH